MSAAPGEAVVRLPLRVVERYGERFEQPELQWVEGGAYLRLAEARVGADGAFLGLARLVVRARREGGALVVRVPADVWVEGAATPAEVSELAAAGERLLALFGRLCACARLPEDCDCCGACGGRGGSRGAVCRACAGLGYAPDGDEAMLPP